MQIAAVNLLCQCQTLKSYHRYLSIKSYNLPYCLPINISAQLGFQLILSLQHQSHSQQMYWLLSWNLTSDCSWCFSERFWTFTTTERSIFSPSIRIYLGINDLLLSAHKSIHAHMKINKVSLDSIICLRVFLGIYCKLFASLRIYLPLICWDHILIYTWFSWT